MSTQTRPQTGGHAGDDYWIEAEWGSPSLASLAKRIAAFRNNPNHRSARVTAAQLADVLEKHPREEWPDDIVAYKSDLEAGRVPPAQGREPFNVWQDDAWTFLYEEYQHRRRVLGEMHTKGTLTAWRAERHLDARLSVGDLAIDSIRREFGLYQTPERLRNLFSALKQNQKRE